METENALSKIEKYLKVITKLLIEEKTSQLIIEADQKKVYEMTGINKREEIIEKTGLSAGTISALWIKWESIGLIEKEGKIYKKVVE